MLGNIRPEGQIFHVKKHVTLLLGISTAKEQIKLPGLKTLGKEDHELYPPLKIID